MNRASARASMAARVRENWASTGDHMTGPDFAEQARRAFERDEPCDDCYKATVFTCCAGDRAAVKNPGKGDGRTLFIILAGVCALAAAALWYM